MKRYTLVLFDYVGSGQSELSSFSVERYSSLDGYALDIIEILDALEHEKVAFVGHSVSSMIGLIAAIKRPELMSELVMVCPSPCFLNDPPQYEGGFDRADLEELLKLMDKNYIGWAEYLAPIVMGANTSAELIGELSGSFCSTDPLVAKTFANATFLSDHRDLLPQHPIRSLIVQSESDQLASQKVGRYIHDKMPHSDLAVIASEGHCLHMTDPEMTSTVIMDFLSD